MISTSKFWENPEDKLQIVAVLNPIVNSNDVAEWPGVSKGALHSVLLCLCVIVRRLKFGREFDHSMDARYLHRLGCLVVSSTR